MAVKNYHSISIKSGSATLEISGNPDKDVHDARHSFVDPTASLAGIIELGKKVYIGPFVRVEAKVPYRVKLTGEDNLQDNVSIFVSTRDTTIGEQTSVAHGAQIINSTLGHFVFIGFNAFIENSVIEDGAMILHGARVIGVTIPKDRIVPPGSIVTSEDQTKFLLPVEEANIEFKEEVISVNIELASGYRQLEPGNPGLNRVSPNPRTSWNNESESLSLAVKSKFPPTLGL